MGIGDIYGLKCPENAEEQADNDGICGGEGLVNQHLQLLRDQ